MFNGAFFRMAYFNLWRRKSRTILIILMLSFGLSSMIFSQGLYEGQMVQMVNDQIRTSNGEIAIYAKGYEESKLLSYHIKNTKKIENLLEKDQKVLNFTSRIKCEGVVSSAKFSQGASIIGIDIGKEQEFINYKKPIVEGKFNLEKNKNQAIIGKKLAEKLKVSVGKKIVISGQAIDKEIAASAVRVVGIVTTNNPQIDVTGVLMDKTQVQKLFKLDGVTEFTLLLKPDVEVETFKKTLTEKLSSNLGEELELFTWKELYPIFSLWDKVFKYFIYISYAIIFLIVSLGIFFILLISILERIKEFGILMAVGTPFKSIAKIIFLESLTIGALGYSLGALGGFLLLIFFKKFGLDLSHFSSGLIDYGMAAVMFPELKLEYFIVGFIAILSSTIAAVIIPLWKLKRLKAVEAIRFV